MILKNTLLKHTPLKSMGYKRQLFTLWQSQLNNLKYHYFENSLLKNKFVKITWNIWGAFHPPAAAFKLILIFLDIIVKT